MARHNDIGNLGEEIAARYLESQGYQVLARQWRWQRIDLDIVALQAQTVVFVEVKARSSTRLAPPETAVTPAKQRRLGAAAQAYLDAHYAADTPMSRFDVVAVSLDNPEHPAIEHFQDAFYLVSNS